MRIEDGQGYSKEIPSSQLYYLREHYRALLPKPHPACQAVIVIPVCKEDASGRIRLSIEELRQQTVPHFSFETLLIVNNPHPLDPSFDQAAYHENKTTLNYLKLVNDSTISALDATSGQLGSRHMGYVRGMGTSLAIIQLQQTRIGTDGVIIQLDADTRVTPSFIATMLDTYKDPELEAAVVGKLPLSVDFPSDDFYLGVASDFAQKVVRNFRGKRLKQAGGPAISFRAKVSDLPGFWKFASEEQDEDWVLGEVLSNSSKFRLLPEPRVHIADRIRPEGWDAKDRQIYARDHVFWPELSDLLIGLNVSYFQQEKLVLSWRDYENMSHNDIYSLVTSQLVAHSETLHTKFLDYMVREQQLLDTTNINQVSARTDLLLMGKALFALSRLLLDHTK